MHPEVLPRAETSVLKKLAALSRSQALVLAGGTGAALHLGHRISRDLDFFTSQPLDSEKLFLDMKALGLTLSVEHQAEGGLIVRADGTKVSAFHCLYPFIERPTRYLGVAVAGLGDIAAMKFIATSQRGKKRDFADLYRILQDVPGARLASVLARRYGKERVNPVHIGKSLVYFQDAEDDPDPEYLRPPIAWPAVKAYFRAHVRQLVLDLDAALRETG